MGNDTEVETGGVQWFNAGKGLMHSEMPGSTGISHGLQLWVNLPLGLKQSEPDYRQIDPDKIITQTTPDGSIRTIIGPRSILRVTATVLYQDIHLNASARITIKKDRDLQGFIYVVQGSIEASGALVYRHQAFVTRNEELPEIKTREGARFVIVMGKPLGEPIRVRGSVVE